MKRILFIVALFHGLFSMVSAQVFPYTITENKEGCVAVTKVVDGLGREISRVTYPNSDECIYYSNLSLGLYYQGNSIFICSISYIGLSPLEELKNKVIYGQDKVNIQIHLKETDEVIETNARIKVENAENLVLGIGSFFIFSGGTEMSTNRRKASDTYEHVSHVFRLLCLHDIDRIDIETKPGEMSSVRFDKIKTAPTYKAMALDLEKKTGKQNYFNLPKSTEAPEIKQSQIISKPIQTTTIERKQQPESKDVNDKLNSVSIRRTEHQVKRGETLESIAKKYGVSKENILDANPGIKTVYAGTTLKIPSIKTTYIERKKTIVQQNEKSGHPEMKFDSLSINVGTIDWNKQKRIVIGYEFVNAGDADLRILQVLGGDYLSFMYPTNPIPPNGKGEIVVMYNIARSYDEHLCNRPNGPFKKGITVVTNDKRERYRLFLNGVIKNSNY